MARGIERLVEELDAAAEDMQRTQLQNLPTNLSTWFYILNHHHGISETILAELIGKIDYAQWYEQQKYNKGMGGSAINYPVAPDLRLGARLWILHQIANNRLDPLQYAADHLGSIRRGSRAIDFIVRDLFNPAARDLRRRLLEEHESGHSTTVPAADRTVRIDHNSSEYRETDEALQEVENALRETNAEIDPVVREQAIAEVSAGRRLLQAARVRAEAARAVLYEGLQWIGRQLAENIAGALITAALAAVGRLLGLW